MEVGINPDGLRSLLESPTGPVGIEVQIKAAHVVAVARRNVAIIMDDFSTKSNISVEGDIDYTLGNNLDAVIGIRETGSVTRYLAKKELRERVWLVSALEEVFP